MNEPKSHYTEWEKPDSKHIVLFHCYMISQKTIL